MAFTANGRSPANCSRSSMAAPVAGADPGNSKVLTADGGGGNSGGIERAVSIASCHPGLVPKEQQNDAAEDQHRGATVIRFSPARNDVGLHSSPLQVKPGKV